MMIDIPFEGAFNEYAGYATAAAAGGVLACLAVFLAARRRRRTAPQSKTTAAPQETSGRARTDRGDLLAAAIATAVSADGMWRTFADLGMPMWLRALTFAFLELAVVQSARRAKRSMEARHSVGIDGVAMWVLTCLSAVLSAAHEVTADVAEDPSPAVVLVRLVAPLVAAWGWERHMALERRRLNLRNGINWRFTLERLAVKVGLAEASARTTEQVDARRRITRVAQAVKALAVLEAAGAKPRQLKRAQRRLDQLMQEANEHAGLARDEQLQAELMAEIGSLLNTAGMSQLNVPAWWTPATATADPRPVVCVGRQGGAGCVAVRVREPGKGLRVLYPAEARTEETRTPTRTADRLMRLLRTERAAKEAMREAVRGAPADVAYTPVRARTEPLGLRTEPRTDLAAEIRTARTASVDQVADTDEGAVIRLPRHTWLADEQHVRLPEPRTEARSCTDVARTSAARTARTEGRADVRQPRSYWVAVLAAEIRTARTEGRTWEPTYEGPDGLRARTGWGRSWCEKTVRAARKAAEGRTDEGAEIRTGTDGR